MPEYIVDYDNDDNVWYVYVERPAPHSWFAVASFTDKSDAEDYIDRQTVGDLTNV